MTQQRMDGRVEPPVQDGPLRPRGARAVLGHNVRALVEALEPRELRLDALLDAARELDLF